MECARIILQSVREHVYGFLNCITTIFRKLNLVFYFRDRFWSMRISDGIRGHSRKSTKSKEDYVVDDDDIPQSLHTIFSNIYSHQSVLFFPYIFFQVPPFFHSIDSLMEKACQTIGLDLAA